MRNPSELQTTDTLRMIWAFARCLQFHVRRQSTSFTAATATCAASRTARTGMAPVVTIVSQDRQFADERHSARGCLRVSGTGFVSTYTDSIPQSYIPPAPGATSHPGARGEWELPGLAVGPQISAAIYGSSKRIRRTAACPSMRKATAWDGWCWRLGGSRVEPGSGGELVQRPPPEHRLLAYRRISGGGRSLWPSAGVLHPPDFNLRQVLL